jgi:hypothetical protein
VIGNTRKFFVAPMMDDVICHRNALNF